MADWDSYPEATDVDIITTFEEQIADVGFTTSKTVKDVLRNRYYYVTQELVSRVLRMSPVLRQKIANKQIKKSWNNGHFVYEAVTPAKVKKPAPTAVVLWSVKHSRGAAPQALISAATRNQARYQYSKYHYVPYVEVVAHREKHPF